MDCTSSFVPTEQIPGPTKAPRHSREEWKTAKPRVEQLYVIERQTLKHVMQVLRDNFAFAVSEKQLKSRIEKWGFDVKNIKGETMIRMACAKVKRRLQGKGSEFRVKKKPVDGKKINRYLKRKDISVEDLLSMESPVDAPSPAFSVSTPSPSTPISIDCLKKIPASYPSAIDETSTFPINRYSSIVMKDTLSFQNLAPPFVNILSDPTSATGAIYCLKRQDVPTFQSDDLFYKNITSRLSSPELLMRLFHIQTCADLRDRRLVSQESLLHSRPLGNEAPALYHAVAALATFHTSKNQPKLRLDAMEHMQDSMGSLVHEIDELSPDIALATTIALAFAESWNQGMFQEVIHLRAAKALLEIALARERNGRPTTRSLSLLKFLYHTWTYLDILARLITTDEEPGPGLDETLPKFAKCHQYEDVDIDPMMGCASTLFPLVRRALDLCAKVRLNSVNSITILSQAIALAHEIERWSPDIIFLQVPEELSSDVQHALHTADAYRFATLLYLHQEFPELTSRSSAELWRKTIASLSLVPLNAHVIIVQLYPLFLAGCEACAEHDRQWIRERWQAISARMWVGNVEKWWTITQEVWKRRDENAMSKQTVNTSPQKGVEDEENADLTVRGRLHWAGVMRDWGWEVSIQMM